jgi:hypothetical protein
MDCAACHIYYPSTLFAATSLGQKEEQPQLALFNIRLLLVRLLTDPGAEINCAINIFLGVCCILPLRKWEQ